MKLRHPNCLRPQPAWMAALVAGSVIHRPRGSWRVVREVSRYQNGDLRAVALAIKRCSWTRRCYTILNANDMIQLGYGPVPVGRRKLRGRLDRDINRSIHQPCWEPRILTCCDVEGVA